MPEIHEKPRVHVEDSHRPPELVPGGDKLPGYAELHALSNFSFQRGASHAKELVCQAYDLGYEAIAITDECSVAGAVRAWKGWKDYREQIAEWEKQDGKNYSRTFKVIYGSEFDMGDGRLVALARDKAAWSGLCDFITEARMKAEKGSYDVGWQTSRLELLAGCEVLFAPVRSSIANPEALHGRLRMLKDLYGESVWIAVELLRERDDTLWVETLRTASRVTGVALVAAGDVHMHARSRKPLQDVMTAVRMGKPIRECGQQLQVNGERYLRTRIDLAGLYPQDAFHNTLKVAGRVDFDLKSLQYNYPKEAVPEGMTPTEALRAYTMAGAEERFKGNTPPHISTLIEKELLLIADCKYEMFFLTVHDIVREAKRLKILCQGRGSAANSVVCYCLGITAADPRLSHPLLERFISKDRQGDPPDIDVDFEHERREEIIQYIYKKYGRDRAAIAAVVICYRTRSAIRDVGMALGIGEPLIDAFAKEHFWFDDALAVEQLGKLAEDTGVALNENDAQFWIRLTRQLKGSPRHLSQHVGGFVLTQDRLGSLVPIENASMKDRSVIQWDKDDLEALGLLKVDVLALGMLTALRRCLDFRRAVHGVDLQLHEIPHEDEATYKMIRAADTVGVFQIESRAQMSMLPRLKPTEFYDLVVEVAIVRPGPISGGMVHPYLKARARREQKLDIKYERSAKELPGEEPRLKKALERTLGVPIFQEQVMEISMIAAGYDGNKADHLRRSMAAWRRTGDVRKHHDDLIHGMLANGYTLDFAERIFKQIEGFGEYGFPESHAYSFALLAYASSWLKCHEPDCFLAAMLNSQPMGFYSPSQLIQDARRKGIESRAPDVSFSDFDCTLEAADETADEAKPVQPNVGRPLRPVRIGLRLVSGLNKEAAERIVAARAEAPFADAEDLALRAMLEPRDMHALASGDALKSLSGHRRQQVWDAAAQKRPGRLLRDAPLNETPLQLPEAPEGEEIVFDYSSLGFTLRRHPVELLRPRLARMNMLNASQLSGLPHGRRVAACGIVTVRQQPQTAGGTIFVTLEDETGPVNVIVWKSVREEQREALLRSRLLAVEGTWQRDVESGGQVCHLVAEQLTDMTKLLGRLGRQRNKSRDFM